MRVELVDTDHTPYFDMLRRCLRAAGRRVADGDAEDLAHLLSLKETIDLAVDDAVRGLRTAGVRWQSIADVLGTTRQACIMRWGRSAKP